MNGPFGVEISKKASLNPVKFVSRTLDDRALRSARDLAPVGTELADGTKISEHTIKARNWGMRSVDTHIARDGKNIGEVQTELTPTRRAYIGGMHVDENERGKGIGTSALKTLTDRAPKAKKVRSVHWTAVGDKSGESHGAYAWRHGDARYTKGVGVPKTASAHHKLDALDPDSKKQAKKYIRRSKVGLQKPSDLASGNKPDYMSDQAADSVRGMAWWGSVRGADRSHPMKNTAAGVVGVGGVAENRKREYDRRK